MALSIKQKKLILCLKEEYFIVSNACKKANISREMYYRWLREVPEFSKAVNDVEQDFFNLIEDRLKTASFNKQPWAIKFFLSRRHPNYKPKLEVSEGYNFEFENGESES